MDEIHRTPMPDAVYSGCLNPFVLPARLQPEGREDHVKTQMTNRVMSYSHPYRLSRDMNRTITHSRTVSK